MRPLLAWLVFAAFSIGCASGGGGPVDAAGNRPRDAGTTDANPTPTDGGPPIDGASDPDSATSPDAFIPVDGGDPCAVCDPAAACDTRMGVLCVCPAGYADPNGDGSLCTPPGACASATCDVHATCMEDASEPAGYRCTCGTGWMGSGAVCADVDECTTGMAACSPLATCSNVLGSYGCTCIPGTTGDGRTCTDTDECSTGAAGCSPFATCLNSTPGFTCTCMGGYMGDGRTCTPVVTVRRVLIYDDTADTRADDAVYALGHVPTVATAGDFAAQFAAGGWDAVVIDSAFEYLGADVVSAVTGWAGGGGRTVLSYWSLDSQPGLASTLGVSTGGSFYTPRLVYPDGASTAPFFATFPAPLTFSDGVNDDGDVVTPLAGFVAGRFDSPGGPSALAVTAGGRVVVDGFSMFEANTTDNDFDGISDAQELWQSEIAWVLSH